MPREPPATPLCLSVIVGAGQGRNFSLKFSSLIRFSYSLWTSIPWAHEGSMWICSLVLVELQAQQCRGNNCVFFHWLHWSMLAAAGMAGKREQNLFGKGHCSKWQNAEEAAAERHVSKTPMLEVQTLALQSLQSHDTFRSELCLPHCVVLRTDHPLLLSRVSDLWTHSSQALQKPCAAQQCLWCSISNSCNVCKALKMLTFYFSL